MEHNPFQEANVKSRIPPQFMEADGSLKSSQESASSLYPKLYKFNSQPQAQFHWHSF
jgi:hypothetical protein